MAEAKTTCSGRTGSRGTRNRATFAAVHARVSRTSWKIVDDVFNMWWTDEAQRNSFPDYFEMIHSPCQSDRLETSSPKSGSLPAAGRLTRNIPASHRPCVCE
jgi:hypothetical protein